MAPPAREMTDLEHERRIRAYLGFVTFDDQLRKEFEQHLAMRAADGVLADDVLTVAEDYLHKRKVVFPARSTLERMIGRVTSRAEEDLLARVKERLPVELCAQIDALLAVPDGDRRLAPDRPRPRRQESRLPVDRSSGSRAMTLHARRGSPSFERVQRIWTSALQNGQRGYLQTSSSVTPDEEPAAFVNKTRNFAVVTTLKLTWLAILPLGTGGVFTWFAAFTHAAPSQY
jgi:hypothetical protein